MPRTVPDVLYSNPHGDTAVNEDNGVSERLGDLLGMTESRNKYGRRDLHPRLAPTYSFPSLPCTITYGLYWS